MQVISGDQQPAIKTLNGVRYGGSLVLLAAAVHPVVSSAWPPSGIAFAVLVLLGLRFWPAIAVGAFVVNLLGGIPPVGALSIATGNTLEAVVGVWLLTRVVRFRPTLDRLRDVLALVLLATASTAISATVGTIALNVFGGAGGRSTETIWLAWATGDSIGILILTPLI